MQPASAFVVVCSILAMHIPSPAESADDANGNADMLFQAGDGRIKGYIPIRILDIPELVKGLDGSTPIFVTKRSFEEKLEGDTGATATCVKAVKTFANETASQCCVTVKAGTVGTPFLSTFIKDDENKIKASVGQTSTTVTALYVDQKDGCYIIEISGMTSTVGNSKACDLLSTKLDSSSSCDAQFTSLCGGSPIPVSSTSSCSDMPTPPCTGTQ